ncbi:uncharacterized protein F5147DRAFT_765282 [Suillus discolor]|uniref:Uncharacterized protein n=1 Tax=Suillus discolor TaxID=1912936 RepID=A0A9P7JL48_9AGAM|nr:uncharacterized protein F5147DRAFT_765282 [Suillus discolor]KAG2084124.1 hypothetical protein F5147DRAFT_765282 [Suillus discolor]
MSREELWDYGCTFCCESEAYQIALPEGLSRRFLKPNNLKTAIGAAHVVLRDGFFELVLTGHIIGADEAERWGILWVVPEGSVVDEVVKVAKARDIAVNAGEDAVNAAFEMSLAERLRFEKRLFVSTQERACCPLLTHFI